MDLGYFHSKTKPTIEEAFENISKDLRAVIIGSGVSGIKIGLQFQNSHFNNDEDIFGITLL